MATQQIDNPFGITVFGSAIVRVSPDIAVIQFSVSRLAEDPQKAFQETRESAQKIQAFFVTAGIKDSGSSLITLRSEYQYQQSVQKFAGYRAAVEFRVILTDMSRMEEVLLGVVEAGAVSLQTQFQTTRLKELRAEARRQAVSAAQVKAENYCHAAGVGLGELIHIEDVNPDVLVRYGSHGAPPESLAEDNQQAEAFNPASIQVTAAVILSYKINDQPSGKTHLGFASE